MKRKRFISSILTAGFTLPWLNANAFVSETEVDKSLIIPPYLKPGDMIGITCPAGFITAEEIQPALDQLQSWGFKVMVGKTVNQRDHTFGGTDRERAADFQQMLNNSSVKAIMCARGGYGFVRIIDQIDFSSLVRNPKWIIGFSDVTVLHCHLNRVYNIASIHSKMTNSFPAEPSKATIVQTESINSIKEALTGNAMKYVAPFSEFNRSGTATGTLIGGNLSILQNLAASASDIDTKNKILFVEDTGEYLYSVDRMFWNLKRSGKLDNLAGLLVGGFKLKSSDDLAEFGKSVEEIVMEKVAEYRYPVCFNFPVGHQVNNFALRCGLTHKLVVDNNGGLLNSV